MASYVSRYSRAFAEVVTARRIDAGKAIGELDAMADIMRSSPQLRTVWENPSVPAEQKLHLLDAIVKRAGVSREVRNFIAVLIDHRRIAGFQEIVAQCKQEINQRMGIADAEITSARELDMAQKRLLETELAQLTGKTVRARYSQDPKLMGGAVVRVGSTIYDGSLRGQLQRLREQLTNS